MKFNTLKTEDGIIVNINDNQTCLTECAELNIVDDLIKVEQSNNNLYKYINQPIQMNSLVDFYQVVY